MFKVIKDGKAIGFYETMEKAFEENSGIFEITPCEESEIIEAIKQAILELVK